MISIFRHEVPVYLQSGFFFESLSVEETDSDSFEVPQDCFKKDLSLQSLADVNKLFHSLRYWGVEKIPDEAIVYLLMQEVFFLKQVAESFKEFDLWCDRLVRIKSQPSGETIAIAISIGFQLSTIQILHEIGTHALTSKAVFAAVSVDAVEILTYLHDQGCICNTSTAQVAVKHGSLQCLKYLHSIQCCLGASILDRAAEAGHLPVVQFLHGVDSPLHTIYTMQHASVSGNLQVVQYLYEQAGCKWSESICAQFAQQNNLDCLTYAHMNGCPWGAYVCAVAATHGHLSCLQYAHSHGCPWDIDTIYMAEYHGHIDCLQYAREHGCPMGSQAQLYLAALCSFEGFCYCVECAVLYLFVCFLTVLTVSGCAAYV